MEWKHPLVERYATPEMVSKWAPETGFKLWRRLWLSLATAEHEFGLGGITSEHLEELTRFVDDLNMEFAKEKEKELRHDVMAHIHAYGEQCKTAAGIIHLGATSCFVADNAQLVQIFQSLELVRDRLRILIRVLSDFALRYRDLPTLGYTHFQPAQLVTVGKRAALWTQDFVEDLRAVQALMDGFRLRGIKGTTGTQASFLQLLKGDKEAVKKLEDRVVELMGFKHKFPITGQTYPRKFDFNVLSALSGIGQSACKVATDIRLLAHLKEVEEPFGSKQVGSSAMPYKRNPMRCERVCSLSRFLVALPAIAAQTASTQWMERTLDDSACRRLILPEGFLAADAIVRLMIHLGGGLMVYPKVIEKHIFRELPFMVTETILMECVSAGGNRQDLHERLREHSMEASRVIKEEGGENDLLERIEGDKIFSAVHGRLNELIDARKFIGRCPEQVEEFVRDCVDPLVGEVDVATVQDVTV